MQCHDEMMGSSEMIGNRAALVLRPSLRSGLVSLAHRNDVIDIKQLGVARHEAGIGTDLQPFGDVADLTRLTGTNDSAASTSRRVSSQSSSGSIHLPKCVMRPQSTSASGSITRPAT